jgi:hypothetical protein
VFCVNSTGDKIIFSILRRNLRDGAVGDGISYFYGIKIRNRWYFFRGENMVLPREFYQKDRHTPLSFEKLRQIATANIYRRYLKQNRRKEWEINDAFFNNLSNYDAYSFPFTTQEAYDESWLRLARENWERERR